MSIGIVDFHCNYINVFNLLVQYQKKEIPTYRILEPYILAKSDFFKEQRIMKYTDGLWHAWININKKEDFHF